LLERFKTHRPGAVSPGLNKNKRRYTMATQIIKIIRTYPIEGSNTEMGADTDTGNFTTISYSNGYSKDYGYPTQFKTNGNNTAVIGETCIYEMGTRLNEKCNEFAEKYAPIKEVFKVKVFVSGKEDGEYGYPKGTTRSDAIDNAVSSYAHNNRILIKLYGKANKKLSEVVRRPTRLFGTY